jgi:hypothetical protein
VGWLDALIPSKMLYRHNLCFVAFQMMPPGGFSGDAILTELLITC